MVGNLQDFINSGKCQIERNPYEDIEEYNPFHDPNVLMGLVMGLTGGVGKPVSRPALPPQPWRELDDVIKMFNAGELPPKPAIGGGRLQTHPDETRAIADNPRGLQSNIYGETGQGRSEWTQIPSLYKRILEEPLDKIINQSSGYTGEAIDIIKYLLGKASSYSKEVSPTWTDSPPMRN